MDVAITLEQYASLLHKMKKSNEAAKMDIEAKKIRAKYAQLKQ